MAYDEALAGRVRAALSGTGTTEKKMFGGLVFMTGGHLTVGVYGDGLIARVGAEGMAKAVTEPGVRPFQMGARAMRGFVLVPAETLDDSGLDSWITRARRHVASLPPRLQMFLAGCPAELAAKRDRINARQVVMRTMLALAEDVHRTAYWNLAPEYPGPVDHLQMMHLLIDKLPLLGYRDGDGSRRT